MGTNYYAVGDDDSRIHLTKLSVGWDPAIQWHAGSRGCGCGCSEHHYRNFNELESYVKRPGITVVDEYGEEWDADGFLDKLQSHKEENRRRHNGSEWPEFVRIDGWDFMGGDWL